MPFDFSDVVAPFRMQPGLRRIAPGDQQLTPNRAGDRALREKLAVLSSRPQQVLLAVPGFDDAPVLTALLQQATDEHPDAFEWDGDAAVTARHLGWSLRGDSLQGDGPAEIGRCLAALPGRWRLPGLLCLALAEDFAVLDGADASIPWLAVCLPSHWAPETKLGRHFAEVHQPVADNQLLVQAGAHLARLVTGIERWQRQVWTVTRHPRLHAHPDHTDPTPWPSAPDAQALAAFAWFRTERQTFIPLPELHVAIFTIHVELTPLPSAIDSADKARRLHDAIASMSPAVLAYRELAPARERLLAWLHSRTKAHGP